MAHFRMRAQFLKHTVRFRTRNSQHNIYKFIFIYCVTNLIKTAICGVQMAESLLIGIVFSDIYCLGFSRVNLNDLTT